MIATKKLPAALLCALLLCTLCFAVLAEDVTIDYDVPYIEYEWDESGWTGQNKTCVAATVLKGNEATLSAGWYVAKNNVSFSSRPIVEGDVFLILKDGCNVSTNSGIDVSGEQNSLTIYAQSDGENMGSLTASTENDNAGIGGMGRTESGEITIHGGKIDAVSNGGGACIGGGAQGSGKVTIYGGTVTATNKEASFAAGIGGGRGSSGDVTIYGGTVTATSVQHSRGACIGGGEGSSGDVFIYGGTVKVTAERGSYGAGIGGGDSGDGRVMIFDGTVTAKSMEARNGGAGIGGGYLGRGTVWICGGTVTATASGECIGIGNGCNGQSGGISLEGAFGKCSVKSDSYSGTVELRVAFIDEDGNLYGKGEVSDNTILKGKTLRPCPTYEISASALPAAGGTVSGGGTYDAGTEVTVTATPNPGYRFVNWTENGQVAGVEQSLTVAATADRTLIANFIANYAITASAFPSEGGIVSGGGTYDAGAEVTVTATANPGYRFVNWTENGQVVGAEQSLTVTATADRTLIANFIATYEITASAFPPEGGTVSGEATYDDGSLVTVTAMPSPGYRFVNWTEEGEVVSMEASFTFTITKGRTLGANFEKLPPFDAEHVTFTIPAERIEANAFEGDESIAIVDASHCASIGEHAFSGCTGMTQILLPADCVFPASAFDGCEALLAIYAPEVGVTQDCAKEAGIPFALVE